MKKFIVAGFAVVLLVATGIFVHEHWLPYFTIRRLQAAYLQVEKGMSAKEVERLMDYPSRSLDSGLQGWWDEQRLTELEEVNLRKALRYQINTFYLPVIFEFTFDADGKIVGRHRYD